MRSVEKIRYTWQASIGRTCQCYGLHRDAYYQLMARKQKNDTVAARIIELVNEVRVEQPRVGTRKLYEALESKFEAMDLKVGRDKLFSILREHEMLVKRKKTSCKTTA